MELSPFQLFLAIGLLPIILSHVRQYHLIQDLKNWTDAQTFCRLHYADLAVIETNIEMTRLLSKAKKNSFMAEAWVGLYNDIESWRWSYKDSPLGTEKKWAYREPDNRNGHEECGLIGQDGLWRDAPCSVKFAFLCYDETKTDATRFVPVYDFGRTWLEAQKYCRLKYTDLACPSNDADNSAITPRVPNSTTWFGLYRDSWKWSDQASVSTIRWNTNQPNNVGGKENCGFVDDTVFVGPTDGWFNDGTCSFRRAFFCQTIAKESKKQTVSVVVQSDRDVNDPAVKATILDKIQQALKEQGMEESMLRWIEHPDGKVFHKKKNKNIDTWENGSIEKCDL